jgi:hypothetical protein
VTNDTNRHFWSLPRRKTAILRCSGIGVFAGLASCSFTTSVRSFPKPVANPGAVPPLDPSQENVCEHAKPIHLGVE